MIKKKTHTKDYLSPKYVERRNSSYKRVEDESATCVKKKSRGKIIQVQYQNSPNVGSMTHRTRLEGACS